MLQVKWDCRTGGDVGRKSSLSLPEGQLDWRAAAAGEIWGRASSLCFRVCLWPLCEALSRLKYQKKKEKSNDNISMKDGCWLGID